MGAPLDIARVRESYAFRYYKDMLDKKGISHNGDAPFAAKPNDPVFIIQTQGYMPTKPFRDRYSRVPEEERGWVKSGVDTGGQTFYALEEAMAMADLGQDVVIIAQRFGNDPRYLPWYKSNNGGQVSIFRVPAGGVVADTEQYPFVRKEELYPALAGMTTDVAAIAFLLGAKAFIGGYADGGIIATAAADIFDVPSLFIAHSMGHIKRERQNLDRNNPATYFEPKLFLGARVMAERAAFLSASSVISNTPEEEMALAEYYGIHTIPHRLIPPGVGSPFFEVNDPASPINNPKSSISEEIIGSAISIMKGNKFFKDRYFISWGRIAEAKNLQGQARLLGELRKLYPGKYDDIKLVVVGGDPAIADANKDNEEVREIRKLESVAREYGLTFEDHIVRIGNLSHGILAQLARDAIAYLGTQTFEPFGMAPAEMMATGGNGFVIIPKVAGFSQWLEMNHHPEFACIIDIAADPRTNSVLVEKYQDAARKVHDFINNPDRKKRIKEAAAFAKDKLRWESIANEKLELIKELAKHKASSAQTGRDRRGYAASLPFWHRQPKTILGNEPLVSAAITIAEDVRQLKHTNGRRTLVAVSGDTEQSPLVSELVWAALGGHRGDAVIVPREVLENINPGDISALRTAEKIGFGGYNTYLGGARHVVVDMPTRGLETFGHLSDFRVHHGPVPYGSIALPDATIINNQVVRSILPVPGQIQPGGIGIGLGGRFGVGTPPMPPMALMRF